MREGRRGRPRHGEDHVQRDMQGLSAVNVTVARRVGDDEVGPEGLRLGPLGIRFGTGPPGGREDLGDHRPLLRHVLPELTETGRDDTAPRLDDVFHHLVRIARERIELQAGPLDHGTELAVRRDAHAVPFREAATDRNEGLDVAARADDHDHDGQWRHAWWLGRRGGGGREPLGVRRHPGRGVSEATGGVIEVHLQPVARAVRDGLEPAQGGHAQAAAVQPATQEGGGHRVKEARALAFAHRRYGSRGVRATPVDQPDLGWAMLPTSGCRTRRSTLAESDQASRGTRCGETARWRSDTVA